MYYQVSGEQVRYNKRVNVMEITNQLPLWYQILNLTSNTSYTIATTATTSGGSGDYLEGPLSNTITVNTLPTNGNSYHSIIFFLTIQFMH